MNRPTQSPVVKYSEHPTVSWLYTPTSIAPAIETALTWFEVLGYTVLLQSDIISGQHQVILQSYRNGILSDRCRQAIQHINPTALPHQIDCALKRVTPIPALPTMPQNLQWHQYLLEGIPVEPSGLGANQEPCLKLIDFANLQNNDWLVIHDFLVLQANCQHCLDLVVFVNGLPLAVFHGHRGDEVWSLRAAHLQLQTYATHLPQFFVFNELLIIFNHTQARIGTLNNKFQQFIKIHSANGEISAFAGESEIQTLIQGVFDKRRLSELLQSFIVFKNHRTHLVKKLRSHPFCTIKFLVFYKE